MKKAISSLLVLCLAMGLLLSGCGSDKQQQQQEEQQQQQEQQQAQGEISTLTGEFQGLADSHSVEVLVDGEAQSYQFFDEDVAAALETMETGTVIQFDVETDAAQELATIVKLYDAPAQG